MISRIAVCSTHEEALKAVKDLKDSGFPIEKISLMGEARVIDDHMYLKSLEPMKTMPLAIGAAAGAVTGLLTGIGIFMIPGFGFLYGAGAVIGAIAGFDIGIIGGGLATVLVQIGVKKEDVIKYEEHIKEGKFLIMVKGTKAEIEGAKKILHQLEPQLQLM